MRPFLSPRRPRVGATATISGLLQSTSFTYEGAFTQPLDFSVKDAWAYPNQGMAYDPNGNSGAGSLFLSGLQNQYKTGEISIPALATPAGFGDITGLNAASELQGLVDITENSAYGLRPRGYLVYGSALIISSGSDYDTGGQDKSHWRRDKNLTSGGTTYLNRKLDSVIANYQNPRFYCGYMCHIPSAWQSALGGKALTGWNPDSIINNSSDGPTAGAFDPDDLISNTNVTVTPLLCYPGNLGYNLAAPGYTSDPTSDGLDPYPFWNATAKITGMFIEGSSLVFVGMCGAGKLNYKRYSSNDSDPDALLQLSPTKTSSTTFTVSGDQTASLYVSRQIRMNVNAAYATITSSSFASSTTTVTVSFDTGTMPGTLTTIHDNTAWVYDGSGLTSKGETAYPYRYQMWAYDLNDLAAVKAGTKLPHEVQPYAWWNFHTPFEGGYVYAKPDTQPDHHIITASAYDMVNKKLYFSTVKQPLYGEQVIHRMSVTA